MKILKKLNEIEMLKKRVEWKKKGFIIPENVIKYYNLEKYYNEVDDILDFAQRDLYQKEVKNSLRKKNPIDGLEEKIQTVEILTKKNYEGLIKEANRIIKSMESDKNFDSELMKETMDFYNGYNRSKYSIYQLMKDMVAELGKGGISLDMFDALVFNLVYYLDNIKETRKSDYIDEMEDILTEFESFYEFIGGDYCEIALPIFLKLLFQDIETMYEVEVEKEKYIKESSPIFLGLFPFTVELYVELGLLDREVIDSLVICSDWGEDDNEEDEEDEEDDDE